MLNILKQVIFTMHENKKTVLVVEDEPEIQKMLNFILDMENFKIVECNSGKQAIRVCASIKPDIILLDLGLPDIDGKDVIRAIREWSQVPIIVLSARQSDNETTTALNIGADDYITKPFNIDILLARINASLRNSTTDTKSESELRNGPLRMDLIRHEVFLYDKLIAFTPKEYKLLRHFMINQGKMLTHREILKTIWGASHGNDTSYLRVYIGQIREKIEVNPANPVFIITEPCIGYRMDYIPTEASMMAA